MNTQTVYQSWDEYMSEEGSRFHGYDEFALLSLSSEVRAEARNRIETCETPYEMWEIVNGLKTFSDFVQW